MKHNPKETKRQANLVALEKQKQQLTYAALVRREAAWHQPPLTNKLNFQFP